MLWAQLLFVHGFVSEFHDKHYQWMKNVDSKTGTTGCLSPYIAVHFYVMACNPASYISSWLLAREYLTLLSTYHSKKHHTDINIRECGSFLVELSANKEHTKKEFYINHQSAIDQLALCHGVFWHYHANEG